MRFPNQAAWFNQLIMALLQGKMREKDKLCSDTLSIRYVCTKAKKQDVECSTPRVICFMYLLAAAYGSRQSSVGGLGGVEEATCR
jgi:hypothetical protein